jgi:glycosyltransferase involved in cell wall biosynthesis
MFPRKGVQHFIESVRDMETDWEIVIAGDGPYLDTLKQQAKSARCAIRFTGFLGKTELHGLYEEARILVFPSIRENFPIVLLEGMDTRCAVITTDAEGCAEVVGNAGIVVPKGDPAEIGRVLRQLMNDPERCKELAMLGWARAKSLRWPIVAAAYMEIFAGTTGLPASNVRVETASTGSFPALLHI